MTDQEFVNPEPGTVGEQAQVTLTPAKKTYEDYGIPRELVWSNFEYPCCVDWQGERYVVDPDGTATLMGKPEGA